MPGAIQKDRQLRRLAVQVVAQLPEGEDDALRVLELARRFTIQCLEGEEERDAPKLVLIKSD